MPSEKDVIQVLEHLGYEEAQISLCGKWCSLEKLGSIGTTDQMSILIGRPDQEYAHLQDAETGILLGRARRRKTAEEVEEPEKGEDKSDSDAPDSGAPELSDCLPWAED